MKKNCKYKRGTKTIKIQKAANGLQEVNPDTLGSLGALGATGIEAMTATKYQPKYTSQLKDQDQMLGKSIGMGAGLALNAVAPGLGTLAAPMLSSAGGAIQRGFQNDKLAKFKATDEFNQRIDKANSNIVSDPTANQRMQYPKGTSKIKAPSKVAVAESTGVVKPKPAKVITGLKDIKDKATREYLENQQRYYTAKPETGSPGYKDRYNEEGRLLATHHILNGNPKIKQYPKERAGRAFYRSGENSMYINKDYPVGTDYREYNAELAHAKQNKERPIIHPIKATVEKFVMGDNARYDKKGTEEYNAHSVIEPKLDSALSAVAGKADLNASRLAAMTGQYSKGTKLIEIEGKETPEIHTDANYNLKNLGTKPHSQGGTKVLATEGDIVFPTQNSEQKFNEIMGAIKTGNVARLKKEQSKLPKDKASKYTGGTAGILPKKDMRGDAMYFDGANLNGLYNGAAELGQPGNIKMPARDPNNPYGKNGLPVEAVPLGNGQFRYYKDEVPHLGIKTLGGVQAPENKLTLPTNTGTVPSIPGDVPDNLDTNKVGNNLGNIGKYAGIINNFAQSFKPAEKVDRSYVNPDLIKYEDRSQGLRNQSNAKQQVDMANARNLSAGSAANARANQQMASIGNYSRHESINNNEMGRSDAIDVQNTGTKNQFKQYNNQLKVGYDDADARNRAARDMHRDTAVNDVVKVSQMNERMNNERQYSSDYLNVLNSMYNYAYDPNNIGDSHFVQDKSVAEPPIVKTEESSTRKTGNTTTKTKTSSAIRNRYNTLVGGLGIGRGRLGRNK